MNTIRNSSITTAETVLNCSTNQKENKHLNIENDKIDIHPQNICNACNTTISRQATSSITIGTFQWVEHSQDNCSVCKHFRRHAEGGQPTKVTRGRPRSSPTAESLQATAHPSWGDSEPLHKHSILFPSHPINIEAVECNMPSVWLID